MGALIPIEPAPSLIPVSPPSAGLRIISAGGFLTMSTHLTPGQRAWLQTELQVRQRRLDGLLKRHHEGTSRAEHAHTLLGDDDEVTRHHAMDREVDMALSDLDTSELGALSRALLRLREGGYGVCVACGADIPFSRLQVEPQAARCLACESARERLTRPQG